MIEKYGKAGFMTRISRHFHPRRGWYHVGVDITGMDAHEEEL